MHSTEIRRRFLEFFKENGHAIIPSAPLVPENDPTVLFTTAGMHPLVPYLLGASHPEGRRLASVQKCVRTGDIDEVGDNRHLTFFEMLGNWSLGDYFKKEAIEWSFEFLTSKDKGLGLDASRLYVTVFAGDADAPRDEESIAIWQELFAKAGVSNKVDSPVSEGGRIFSKAKDDNWWGPAGQTGPCGPDSEMFYDLGEGQLATEDGMADFESGRLIEIWNDVFMQYNKNEDGSFGRLEQANVDTGSGLERVAMFMQGVSTPYETDLFIPIINVLKNRLPDRGDEEGVKIVADHLKAAVMMVQDGVFPSNKGQGYVLRRLIRRALVHSQLAEQSSEWIAELIEAVASIYSEAYPEIRANQASIVKVIQDEADRFKKSLVKGLKEIGKLDNLTAKAAFDLYQNYGFPWELSREYAISKGIAIEEADFEAEFEKHKNLSRTASAGQFASGLADHSEKTVQYHTATHLLHQALRTVLGEAVQQKGSNITPERLRFDFSYPEKMTPEQISQVEALVNEQIGRKLEVSSATMSPEQAANEGAIGLFGHKYGESVSVYSMGDFSKEICTGPHVKNTGELGTFRIAKEEAVSAGVRRIKAIVE